MTSADEPSVGSSTVIGRASIFYIFSLDLGFLVGIDKKAKGPIHDLITARGDGSIGERLSSDDPEIGTLSGAAVSEYEQIQQRARRARQASGRSIWSSNILRREAPYVMSKFDWMLRPPPAQNAVDLVPSAPKLRLFRRGALSLTFRYDFDPNMNGPVSVERFVDTLSHLTSELAAEAQLRIIEFLDVARRSGHRLAGIDVPWRPVDENTKAMVENNLVEHSLFFLEAPLGLSPVGSGGEHLDPEDQKVQKSVAATLDTNRLWDHYDNSSTQELLSRANRWRDDELYVTEHRRSLIVLADYWRPEDSLRYYMEDLVLAAAFELARITHIRFLANYLEYAAPEVDIFDGDAAERRDTLVFIQMMQDAVRRSSYDDPTEDLILHKFTAQFLEGISRERRTSQYIETMTDLTDRIAQRIHIQATVTIAEKTLNSARNTLLISVAAAAVGAVSVCVTLLIFAVS